MRSCGKTSVLLVNTGPRSPSQRPMTRSFDIFLFCAWTNGWAKNPDVGDLRRHRAHYDVTVMSKRLNFHAVISVSKSVWTLRPQCVPPVPDCVIYPDSKANEANMGPIWGRQDPGGPHVGPMNFAIRVWRTHYSVICSRHSPAQLSIFTALVQIMTWCLWGHKHGVEDTTRYFASRASDFRVEQYMLIDKTSNNMHQLV